MAKRTRTTRPRPTQKQPATAVGGDPPCASSRREGSVWALLFLLAVALWTACRPVSLDTVWWDLACGRQVIAGSWSPSRDLLALDETAQADWLSGVPVYVLYAALGAHGLMLGRLVCVLALLYWLWRALPWRRTVHMFPVAAALLGLLAAALDPGPPLWDLLAVVAAFSWLGAADHAGQGAATPARLALLALLVVLMVNAAPRAVIAVVVLALGTLAPGATAGAPKERGGNAAGLQLPRLSWRQRGWIMAVVLLASFASPRGMFTLWDSMRLACPWLAAPSWALADTAWRPLITAWSHEPGRPTAWIFAVGSLVLLVMAGRAGFPLRFLLAWIFAQTLAWTSAANAPVAAVILAGFAPPLLVSRPGPNAGDAVVRGGDAREVALGLAVGLLARLRRSFALERSGDRDGVGVGSTPGSAVSANGDRGSQVQRHGVVR